VLARYTTESGSYYAPLQHMWRSGGTSRYPMYDGIGTSRGLANDSATITDTYQLDAWGHQIASTGSTQNPYKYGAAWGYITDPSGLLQLGHRFYWPELGRFVSQDPIGDGMNWYGYVDANPVTSVDGTGLAVMCTAPTCVPGFWHAHVTTTKHYEQWRLLYTSSMQGWGYQWLLSCVWQRNWTAVTQGYRERTWHCVKMCFDTCSGEVWFPTYTRTEIQDVYRTKSGRDIFQEQLGTGPLVSEEQEKQECKERTALPR